MDLATMAGRYPDREAAVVDGRRVTYAELDRAANRLAHHLRDAGLRRGDALAVCAGNGIGVFEAFWAAMRLGLYLVPVNRHLRAAEIRHILTDVATLGSVAVVTDDSTEAEVGEAAAGVPLAANIGIGDGPLAPGQAEHMPDDAWEGQLLLYSSGTSGRPKGVLRALPDLRPGQGPTLGSELAEGFGVRAGDRYLSPGPLNHSAPLAFATACQRVGATAVAMTRFDPAAALDLLEAEAITVSQWVPHDVRAPARPARGGPQRPPGPVRPPPRLPRRRALPGAGQAGHDRLVGADPGRVLQRHRGRPDDDHGGRLAAHPGSVGRHWRGGQVWILDGDGHEAPPGVDGRIYFEAPATGRFGYLNQPEATAAAYRRDRFTLGDVGHLDTEGWLYVTDRDSDMVISGGVNIYPREVENILLEHRRGRRGRARPARRRPGRAVVTAIEPREPGSPVAPDDLIAFCRSRIAAFKCPKEVVYVDALPRSEAGKLDKRLLRERLA